MTWGGEKAIQAHPAKNHWAKTVAMKTNQEWATVTLQPFCTYGGLAHLMSPRLASMASDKRLWELLSKNSLIKTYKVYPY